MKIIFGERLKELRIEAGLKQSDLAAAIGTTQRKISHMECGDIEPDIDTLCSLADYFGVSVDYLLGRNDY